METVGFFACSIRMLEVLAGGIYRCVRTTFVRMELLVAVLGTGKESRVKRLLFEA